MTLHSIRSTPILGATPTSGGSTFSPVFIPHTTIRYFFETHSLYGNMFVLKKLIRNDGFIMNGAISIPSDTYHESILPSLVGFNIMDAPSPVIYFLE